MLSLVEGMGGIKVYVCVFPYVIKNNGKIKLTSVY